MIEGFRHPTPDRYLTPGKQFPTSNPRDVVITEEFPAQATGFGGLPYGIPHGKETACLLCFQTQVKGNNVDKPLRHIYANPRLAQEPYNLIDRESSLNDAAKPVFVRSYLLPPDYTKGTRGTPLTALADLLLTGGGNGYAAGNSVPGRGEVALVISGGGGTGAAGFAYCIGGVIVAAYLTDTGTGYTSAPAVTAAGGSGASMTAVLQPTTALLTKEIERLAEDPFGGYYVRVTRTWETLPGTETIKIGYEDETGARMRTVRQRVAAGTAVVARAASRVFNSITMYCVDSDYEPDDTNTGTLVTVYMEKPATRTDLNSGKVVCPTIFVFLGAGWAISGDGFVNHGPFAGVHYTLTPKRSAVSIEEEISYSVGASGVALPTLWTVISPGAASRFFPLSGDTIHNAIFVEETGPGGTQTEEDLDASTPTSYTIGQDMITAASERPWKYSIFHEKRISTANEPT